MKTTVLIRGAALAATGVAGAAEVTHLNESGALPPGLPFSEAVRVDDTLYLSGQVATQPGVLELVPGGMEAEARQVLGNIRTVLEANGLGLEDVVKCTVMLADIAEWPLFNEVYAEFFSAPFPARSAFAASGLALGARVELECLAVFPD
jgi:2-iminobutanoate/2-iminopropanoate deaminase